MKRVNALIVMALLATAPAMAQSPPDQDALYLQQAAQQTAAELTSAIIGLRATVAKLQAENAKLRAELTKPATAEPAK